MKTVPLFVRFALTAVFVAICAFALLPPAQAQDKKSNGDKPRIALLLSPDGKHHDEFDAALAALGWDAERFPSKPEVMRDLEGRLADFDLLLAAPLFHVEKGDYPDASGVAKYRKFLENGGMLVITDGSYEGVRNWLTHLEPSLGGIERGDCNSSQWAVNGVTSDPEHAHPLRFFPTRITEPNSWPHFLKPGADSKWVTVANCSEGHPVTFAQRVGRGLVSITALRQPAANQLANFRACQLLGRSGLELKSFTQSDIGMGDGKIRLELVRDRDAGMGEFVYEITREGASPERFTARVTADSLELPYRFSRRGAAVTRLSFKDGNGVFPLFSREVEVPELLTIRPNSYRGILSTARRLDEVKFGIELAPDKEELAGLKLLVEVLDSRGASVGREEITLTRDQPLHFLQAVSLKRTLPAGAYQVRARLLGSSLLAESTTDLKLLAPREGQTIVDEDNTLLVNGKPFFPIGLYHVEPGDYPAVAKLGINTVQYWIWHGTDGLKAAEEYGLKAVMELNHKSEDIVRQVVDQYRDQAAVIMWYGLDEPAEGGHGMAEMMRKTFNDADEERPVYMVSCRPDLFAEQSKFGNVFAPDPYGSPQKVLDWTRKAVAAVDGRKPVICVPGVFGKETREELRASVYLALASDVRGILWYPWSQVGGGPVGVGLKNSPEQQQVIQEICGELQTLMPALTAMVRTPFRSEDDALQGIFCIADNERYVLVVNSTPDPIDVSAVIPEAQRADGRYQNVFQSDNAALEIKNARLRLKLHGYETRAYRLK